MDYEAPVVEVLGPASQLVQAFAGPQTDGGGWILSQGAMSTVLDED